MKEKKRSKYESHDEIWVMMRKYTKSKAILPNDTALLKLIYLVSKKITEKWPTDIPKWDSLSNSLPFTLAIGSK